MQPRSNSALFYYYKMRIPVAAQAYSYAFSPTPLQGHPASRHARHLPVYLYLIILWLIYIHTRGTPIDASRTNPSLTRPLNFLVELLLGMQYLLILNNLLIFVLKICDGVHSACWSVTQKEVIRSVVYSYSSFFPISTLAPSESLNQRVTLVVIYKG